MSEFFGRLEAELRAAAERPPRRSVPVPAIAVAGLLALALAPIVLVLGSGSDEAGTRADPSRAETPQDPRSDLPIPDIPGAKVVATGTAPVAGPWEILTHRSVKPDDPEMMPDDPETGEVRRPAGPRCVGLGLLDPPSVHSGGLVSHCGEFPSTPGFSRFQQAVPNAAGRAREILVYGRAPEEAALVRISPDDREPIEMKPIEGPAGEGDFYLFAVPADIGEGDVNWIDEEGNEGSVGQELLPP
jgi:hypothetical protein